MTWMPRLAVCVALLGIAVPATAYVLPGDFLLRTVAEKRTRLRLKDVSIHLAVERPDVDGADEERLYLKMPAQLRWAKGEDDTAAVVVNDAEATAGEDGVLNKPVTPWSFLAHLLMPKGKKLDDMNAFLLGSAKKLGINTELVYLSRDGERVVYCVGANPWEEEKAQMWLTKDGFLPLRVVAFTRDDGKLTRHEIRLDGWGSAAGGNWFPETLEHYVDGELQLKATATKVQVNQSLPESLFREAS